MNDALDGSESTINDDPYGEEQYVVVPTYSFGVAVFLRHSPIISGEACIGTISEVFDAEAPTPRGCVSSVIAELLRWELTLPKIRRLPDPTE